MGNPVRYQEVVDAPACILLPGFEHIAPPGVSAGGFGVQITEGVGKACVKKLGELSSFLVREAWIAVICFRVFQVYQPFQSP